MSRTREDAVSLWMQRCASIVRRAYAPDTASLCRDCFEAVLATSSARLQAGGSDIMRSASGSEGKLNGAEGGIRDCRVQWTT